MSEFGTRSPEHLTAEIWRTENDVEEGLREAFLADRLVNFGHLITTLHESNLGIDALVQLKDDFLREKKGLNMGEVFALALSDKYRGKLHVVELGKTTHPDNSGEVDGLKGEYTDFTRWAAQQNPDNLTIRELTRSESGRDVEVRMPRHEEARGKVMILTRKRPLMIGKMQFDGANLDIAIFKRMVFSVPRETFIALNGKNSANESNKFRFSDDHSLQMIETMLDHSSGGVKPIRTAYYLATDY